MNAKQILRDALRAVEDEVEQHVTATVGMYDENDPTGLEADLYLINETKSRASTWSGGPISDSNIYERIERDTCIRILEKRIERRRYSAR